jgi:hypothetical protein
MKNPIDIENPHFSSLDNREICLIKIFFERFDDKVKSGLIVTPEEISSLSKQKIFLYLATFHRDFIANQKVTMNDVDKIKNLIESYVRRGNHDVKLNLMDVFGLFKIDLEASQREC